jgi:GTPase
VFALFSNYPKLIPESYQRYLENRLRAAFPYRGVPLTIVFKKK